MLWAYTPVPLRSFALVPVLAVTSGPVVRVPRTERGSSTVDQTANGQSPAGFERMRAMLARASDLHADEQRQVVDILDEIRTRLTPIEGFVGEGRTRVSATHDNVATIQRRLTELPDRTE